MNLAFFIASRLIRKGKGNFSRPIIRLAVISVGLGLAVMIVSVAVVTGFKQQIRDKVIGFSGHVQITNYDDNLSYEAAPLSTSQAFYPEFRLVDGVRHIQVFATKAGIAKTQDQIEGVVFKGVGVDYDWSFFRDKIIAGRLPELDGQNTSNEVIISAKLAGRLLLKAGDDLRVYFVGSAADQLRGRKFLISGIYETGLEEFDKIYILGDINHIRKLNGWDSDMVAGFELILDDVNDLERMGEKIFDAIGYNLDARTIRQLHPQIFDWLDLQDMNVIIILVLMVMVSAITMVSTLLILILERTNMIGMLKSMGAFNWSVRKLFLYLSAYIISRGLLFGNFFGLAVCLLQQHFSLISLPQESYYLESVPVNLQFWPLIWINIGTLVLCLLMLVIPTYIVTRISPLKAIVLR